MHEYMQRRELLSGAAVPSLLRRAENEGQLVQGASDITDSLRRTRQALAQTLEQAAGSLAVVGKEVEGSRARMYL
jgi:hypothetical protein